MKKALTVILSICILFCAVNVNASENAHTEISQLYLEKEELSIWEALGLSLNGYQVPESFYEALKEDITNKNGIYRTALEYAKIVILLKSDAKDPKDFYGYNLSASLQGFKDIDKSGINGVIFSIFALMDMEAEPNAIWTKDKLLILLLEYQNEDGGFPLAKGWGSDNDLSAMAVTALSYFPDNQKAKNAMDKALSYLSNKIDSNGLMYYQNSDSSENLSQVVIALSTAGIPLNDERFTRNGKTPYDTLIENYMTEDFRFKHNISLNANDIATEQAYLALSAIKTGYVYAYKENAVPEPSPSQSVEPENTGTPLNQEDTVGPFDEQKLNFSDESLISDEYYDDIWKAFSEKLIVGYGNALRPFDKLTRAEASVLLYNAAGLDMDIFIPRFKDIQKGYWYSRYVIACYLNGIISGDDETFFEPDSYITASELIISLERICKTDIIYDGISEITRESAISLIVRNIYGGIN